VLAFSDPTVIDLARNRFVAVACNDLRLLRQRDAEGDFFRGLAAQTPASFREDPSRQGIYCCSVDGTLLSCVRHMSDTMDVVGTLETGLRLHRAKASPSGGSRTDAFRSLTPDPIAQPTPPPGAVVLRVFTRRLEWTPNGPVASSARLPRHAMSLPPQPQLDHMWLPREACDAIVAMPMQVGASHPVADAALDALCRLHLADTTLKGDQMWSPEQVRARQFTATVESVTGDQATIALRGRVEFAKPWRYSATALVEGRFRYAIRQRNVEDFKMAALERVLTGDRGQTVATYVGMAFEQADGSDPGDAIPPHDRSQYMQP